MMNEPIAKLTQRVALGCHRVEQRTNVLVVVALAAGGGTRYVAEWAKELNRTPRGGRAVLLVFQVASVLCKRATQAGIQVAIPLTHQQ